MSYKWVCRILEVSKWLKMTYFCTFLDVILFLGGVMRSNLFLRHASTLVDVAEGSDEARSDKTTIKSLWDVPKNMIWAQNRSFLHVSGRNFPSTGSYDLKLVPETCQHLCGCCGGVRRCQKLYTAVKSLSGMSRNSKYSRWKVVFGPNSGSRRSYELRLLPETCPHLCGCCGGVRPGQMWYMTVKSLRIQKYSRWKAVEKPFSISRGLQRQN